MSEIFQYLALKNLYECDDYVSKNMMYELYTIYFLVYNILFSRMTIYVRLIFWYTIFCRSCELTLLSNY